MRKLEALTAATFTTGRFKLTPEQMQRRRYVVKVVDAEQLIVEPKGEINFKRGEIIETDIEIGKGNNTLRPLDEDVAETSPAPSQASAPAAVGAPSTTDQSGTVTVDSAGGASGDPDDPLAHVDDAPPGAVSEKGGRKRK